MGEFCIIVRSHFSGFRARISLIGHRSICYTPKERKRKKEGEKVGEKVVTTPEVDIDGQFEVTDVANIFSGRAKLLPLTWTWSGDRIIAKKKDDDRASLVSIPSLIHLCGMSKRLAWPSISRMTYARQLDVARTEMMKIEGVIRARCGESPRTFLSVFLLCLRSSICIYWILLA